MAAVSFPDIFTLTRGSHAMIRDATGRLTYAPNNLLIGSAAPATQNVTTQAIAYILSFTGTGTLTLSGTSTDGPLVGTGVSDRVYLKITPTAGTLTLTKSGTVTDAMLEAVTYQTLPRDYAATTVAAYYGPRLDHDRTGVPVGLMIGSVRENLLTDSEDLSTGNWLKVGSSGSSVTTNVAVAPDGRATADKFVVGTGSGTWCIANYLGPTIAAGTEYVAPVFVKAAGLNYAFMRPHNGFGGLAASGFIVDLTTGAVTYPATPLAPITTATTEYYGDGWWRVDMISTGTISASTSGGPGIWLANSTAFASSGGAAPAAFTGDGTSGIYIWGAGFGTSSLSGYYVPTGAAAVTHNADVVIVSGSDFSDWWGDDEGTILVTARTSGVGTRPILSFDDDTLLEQILLRTVGTTLMLTVIDGGATVADIAAGTITADVPFTAAFRYRANGMAISLNGAAAASDVAASLPTVDRLRIGADKAGNILNNRVVRIRRNAVGLPDVTLQGLSA